MDVDEVPIVSAHVCFISARFLRFEKSVEVAGGQRVLRQLPEKESERTRLRQWAELRSAEPSQAGVGRILRSRAQIMHMNFRHVVALSIYSELTGNGSVIDALKRMKFAR